MMIDRLLRITNQLKIMKIKRALQRVSVLLLVTTVMFSCEPEVDRFTPVEGEQIDVETILDDLEDGPQEFAIDADSDQRVITANEALLTIEKNIFQTKDGAVVTGVVDLEIKELYTKGDIFLNRVPTVSDGKLLESDAVLHISATQDGKPLELIPGKQIQINIPNDNPMEKMELFYGEGGDREDFNWLEADGDENAWDNVDRAEWAVQDSLEELFGYGYECFSDSLQWINVDIFVDVPEDQKTSVCVELPEIYTNTNTYVAMIFKDINSVVGFTGSAETMQFCEPYGLSPIGFDISIIVISTQAEEVFHFGIEDAIISEDLVIQITPEEKTKEEIKLILDGL